MGSWAERIDATFDRMEQTIDLKFEQIKELLRKRSVPRTETMERPIFDGTEVKLWIHWIEFDFRRHNLSDWQKLDMARTCMKGEAKDFVCRQESLMIFRSWNEMKNELVIRFGNEDDPDKIRLLIERDQRLQDFLDKYDARKLREKRGTDMMNSRESTQEEEHDEKLSNDTSTFEISSIQEKELHEAIDSHVILEKNSIEQTQVPGGNMRDYFLVDGVAFKKTFSYAGFEQQPKKFVSPKIILLNIELELKSEKENAEIRLSGFITVPVNS